MTDVPAAEAGDLAPAAEGGDLAYAYRPSLLGAPWQFRLTEGGLDWAAGGKSGHVPFRNVRQLRMSYKPVSMQTHRFVTEIWADGAPRLEIVSSSWKSLVEQERQDRPYALFIAELHRRVAQAGAPVRCTQGRNPILYWPGLVVFLGVALGLALLTARALEAGTIGGAAFVAAFLLLFLWQGGNFFRRNRPAAYRVDAPPPELMPKR